jgi:hypothetical protein
MLVLCRNNLQQQQKQQHHQPSAECRQGGMQAYSDVHHSNERTAAETCSNNGTSYRCNTAGVTWPKCHKAARHMHPDNPNHLLRSHARNWCMPCRSLAPNKPGDRCAGCAANVRNVLLRSCCARRLMLCLAAMTADLACELLCKDHQLMITYCVAHNDTGSRMAGRVTTSADRTRLTIYRRTLHIFLFNIP